MPNVFLRSMTALAASVAFSLLAISGCSNLLEDTDADWPVHGGTDLEQRFSPLTQIDKESVDQLGLAWSHDLDTNRGQEATPIVVDGRMYVSTAWSHVVALDAATGHQLWHYDPKIDGQKGFDACCDVVSRGVAVADGLVLLGALDGRLIALDADSGKEVWSVQTTDPDKPYTITGAPRVMGDKVVIGNGGAEYGVRGYVTAYSIHTGKKLWRFYTVPGGPAAEPDGEASDAVLKYRALPTWAGDWYEHGGGGTVWDAIVYDPELNQLYLGVGNGGPWNHKIRSEGKGDNLFLSSIVAVDPDTGAYKWHYQETPGDSWDYTATQPIILATLTIDGKERKVLMQAPKNGFFYVIDRTDGSLISAENYVTVNWASGIDMETGRPIENPAARYRDESFVLLPSAVGGHNWQPMAFSQQTGLVYIPAYHFAMAFGDDPDFRWLNGAWNTGTNWKLSETPDDPTVFKEATASFHGMLVAWDPIAQKAAWSVKQDTVNNGGVLATAGKLVFQGTGDGRFVARDAETGALVWSFTAPDGIVAGPISYEVRGEQYVAVLAGYGGAFALGEGADAPKQRPNGRVLAFKIGGEAKLEGPRSVTETRSITVPSEQFSSTQIDAGRLLYTQHCYRCHGAGAQSGGILPDLRRSAAISDRRMWNAILVDGALQDRGMVAFTPWLSPREIEDIRAFVSHKARIAGEGSKP